MEVSWHYFFNYLDPQAHIAALSSRCPGSALALLKASWPEVIGNGCCFSWNAAGRWIQTGPVPNEVQSFGISSELYWLTLDLRMLGIGHQPIKIIPLRPLGVCEIDAGFTCHTSWTNHLDPQQFGDPNPSIFFGSKVKASALYKGIWSYTEKTSCDIQCGEAPLYWLVCPHDLPH